MFVEFLPGKQGLLHSSELAEGEDLTDFDLDDRLDVTLLAVSLTTPLLLWLSRLAPFGHAFTMPSIQHAGNPGST